MGEIQEKRAENPSMERAEELVDRMGQQVGHWTFLAGQQIRRFVARAREEAEDIWAEAQSMRRENGR
jgi:hypothetical protein